MSSIEDQLRDAYRGAAETVSPDTIRQLDERSVTILAPGRRSARSASRRLMIPLSAAAAVALVAILTVVVPRALAGGQHTAHHHQSPTSSSASPAGRFLVAVNGSRATALTVRNAITGARVATVATPVRGMLFSGLATGDGRRYVAELLRPGTCRTWLYQFRLGAAGRPGPVTPYALPRLGQLLLSIAVSKDTGTFAYFAVGRPRASERRLSLADGKRQHAGV